MDGEQHPSSRSPSPAAGFRYDKKKSVSRSPSPKKVRLTDDEYLSLPNSDKRTHNRFMRSQELLQERQLLYLTKALYDQVIF